MRFIFHITYNREYLTKGFQQLFRLSVKRQHLIVHRLLLGLVRVDVQLELEHEDEDGEDIVHLLLFGFGEYVRL